MTRRSAVAGAGCRRRRRCKVPNKTNTQLALLQCCRAETRRRRREEEQRWKQTARREPAAGGTAAWLFTTAQRPLELTGLSFKARRREKQGTLTKIYKRSFDRFRLRVDGEIPSPGVRE